MGDTTITSKAAEPSQFRARVDAAAVLFKRVVSPTGSISVKGGGEFSGEALSASSITATGPFQIHLRRPRLLVTPEWGFSTYSLKVPDFNVPPPSNPNYTAIPLGLTRYGLQVRRPFERARVSIEPKLSVSVLAPLGNLRGDLRQEATLGVDAALFGGRLAAGCDVGALVPASGKTAIVASCGVEYRPIRLGGKLATQVLPALVAVETLATTRRARALSTFGPDPK